MTDAVFDIYSSEQRKLPIEMFLDSCSRLESLISRFNNVCVIKKGVGAGRNIDEVRYFAMQAEMLSDFEAERLYIDLYDKFQLRNGKNILDEFPPRSLLFSVEFTDTEQIEFRCYLYKAQGELGSKLMKDPMPQRIVLTQEQLDYFVSQYADASDLRDLVPEIISRMPELSFEDIDSIFSSQLWQES